MHVPYSVRERSDRIAKLGFLYNLPSGAPRQTFEYENKVKTMFHYHVQTTCITFIHISRPSGQLFFLLLILP
jgi:hypothetical protein